MFEGYIDSVIEKRLMETINAVIDNKLEEWKSEEFRWSFREREILREKVEYLNGEVFIDDVIDRIKRKQLK